MKNILLAAGCAFALVAAPVMAQDNSQAAAPSQTDDQQAAPADSQATDASDQQSSQKSFHRHHSMPAHRHNSAAMALNGNESGTAAYQASDRQKRYPAVDHGHVPGDPPVINHDGDQAAVPNPTAATITVPPGH